jgi:hypothetical protein
MFNSVTTEETNFLRLLLKVDANISQEKRYKDKKLAKTDFSDYVEVCF